jgi:DNA-directed RNA polymerase specialized sigma24 family protein
MTTTEGSFQSFENTTNEAEPGAVARPRPANRPRVVPATAGEMTTEFVTFECLVTPLPPGTPATPRPLGRERRVPRVDPAEQTLSTEVRATLQTAVQALPTDIRRILELRLAGVAIPDIAAALNLTLESVSAAIVQVRELLDQAPAA